MNIGPLFRNVHILAAVAEVEEEDEQGRAVGIQEKKKGRLS